MRRLVPSVEQRDVLAAVSRPPVVQAKPPIVPPHSAPPPMVPSPWPYLVAWLRVQIRPYTLKHLVTFFLMLLAILIALCVESSSASAQEVCSAKSQESVQTDTGTLPVSWSTPSPSIDQPEPSRPHGGGTASAVRPAQHVTGRAEPFAFVGLVTGLLLGGWSGRRSRRSKGTAVDDLPINGALDPAPPVRKLGAYSAVGSVRSNNQDRVHVGRAADLDYFVIADGMGGEPRGGEAAELVTAYARERLETELPIVVAAKEEGVRTLLLNIIWGAAMELACVAARQFWREEEIGLRTTLILVVVSNDTYTVAWIGDGGVTLLRADDTSEQLLEPQKDMRQPALLDASLGPATAGRPAWAMAARSPGDLLIAATDGIADQLRPEVIELVRRELDVAGGDAGTASRAVVAALAEQTDEDGSFVFSDNLTLALLTTGRAL